MKKTAFSLFAAALLGSFSGSALAGQDCTKAVVEPEPAIPLDLIHATVEQTFQSDFKEGHGYQPKYEGNNNTNTWHYSLEAARRIALGDNWYLRVGVDVGRYDFGDNRSGGPNTLQSYAAEIGAERFRKGELSFIVLAKPGLYFSHNLDGRAFDIPTDIELFYPVAGDQFFLVGGVHLSLLSNYPVMPLGGILWHISPKWDLQAYLPAPRLVYNWTDALKVWAGGSLTGSSFRMNGEVRKVDYYEIRVGGGAEYKINKIFSVGLDAGCAVARNFKVPHMTLETKPAPYVSVALNAAF